MNESKKIFNKALYKTQRQVLRRNTPSPEILLWSKLKGKQLNGFKFRRQYGVLNFVVDFYCPRCKLAIEIDGNSHYGDKAQQHDADRQLAIQSLGIRFLRFKNTDVLRNIDGVLDEIIGVVSEYKPPLAPPSK